MLVGLAPGVSSTLAGRRCCEEGSRARVAHLSPMPLLAARLGGERERERLERLLRAQLPSS